MAQMQRCFLGSTIPSLGAHGDLEMMEDGTKKELIEKIKHHHESEEAHYEGENKQILGRINSIIHRLGEEVRKLREDAPGDKEARKHHYADHKTNIGINEIEEIVHKINDERAEYITASHRVLNADKTERTMDWLNKKFPKLHKPTWFEGHDAHPPRKLLHWFSSAKRKAYSIYATHITMNTLPEGKIRNEHHGRTERSESMKGFINHYNAARKAIHQLRMMRHHKGGHKKIRKGKRKMNKEGGRKRRPRKNKKGDLPHEDSRLTPFPIL